MFGKIKDYLIRNSIWLLGGIGAMALLHPGISEVKSLVFIVLIEFIALALAGIAVFVYTKVDFTKDLTSRILGQIFLGVHFLVGLSIVGVYYVM
ncbi:MAG: hypothetical protein A2X64_02855 [Ignavibacteria bacterium GWF2_33_9]|nr:MAG: hypothetical protein A2X64_02855 [Ignavibacteria bacterium GWF2_33_9]